MWYFLTRFKHLNYLYYKEDIRYTTQKSKVCLRVFPSVPSVSNEVKTVEAKELVMFRISSCSELKTLK